MAWNNFVAINSTDEGSSGFDGGSSLIRYVSPRASRIVNFGVIPASGRPVITQSTGFEDVLPTGEGLFAFRDMDDILGAMEAIAADYDRHSAAARRIAQDYFRAETVLARLLADLGV